MPTSQLLHATMFLQKEEEIWRLVSMISTVSATNPQIASAFKFEVLESSWKQGETVISQTNIDKASKVSNGHFPNTFLPTIVNLTFHFSFALIFIMETPLSTVNSTSTTALAKCKPFLRSSLPKSYRPTLGYARPLEASWGTLCASCPMTRFTWDFQGTPKRLATSLFMETELARTSWLGSQTAKVLVVQQRNQSYIFP